MSILEEVTAFHVILFPSVSGLRIAHVSLDRILDGLGFCLGFLDQGLELAQLPAFGFQFVHAHCVFLL